LLPPIVVFIVLGNNTDITQLKTYFDFSKCMVFINDYHNEINMFKGVENTEDITGYNF
jgi:hypothetical protein